MVSHGMGMVYSSDLLIELLDKLLLLSHLVAHTFILLLLAFQLSDELELFFIDDASVDFLLSFSDLFLLDVLL